MVTLSKHFRASHNRTGDLHPLQRLSSYGVVYRKQIWLAAICLLLNKIFDLAPPVLIGTAVDVVVKKQNSVIASLGITDSIFGQFLIIAFFTVIVWVLESGTHEQLLEKQGAYAKLWRVQSGLK